MKCPFVYLLVVRGATEHRERMEAATYDETRIGTTTILPCRVVGAETDHLLPLPRSDLSHVPFILDLPWIISGLQPTTCHVLDPSIQGQLQMIFVVHPF